MFRKYITPLSIEVIFKKWPKQIVNWFLKTWPRRLLLILLFVSLLLMLFRPRLFINVPTSTTIESFDNQLLGGCIADDGQWRFPECESIPDKFKQCILTFEDRHFYYHPGVNPVSLFRALVRNIRAGKVVNGGSTITMQVIRLSRNNPRRTYFEKLIEIILAFRTELKYKKDDILLKYVSYAPFGGNIVGLDAASWKYYGVSPDKLSWAESATLAVLPNAPALIHPGRNRNLLVEKRNRLLKKLLEEKCFDTITYQLAIAEPLPDAPKPLPMEAPQLLDWAIKHHKGKRVHTTINKSLQDKVNDILNKHYQVLSGNQVNNAAVLLIDVESGNVLTYIGNITKSGEENHNMVDIIRASRSTGSILKPLLFAAMLDDGQIYNGSLLPDIPTQISGYEPKNFNETYEGAIPASKALSKSLNVPAVYLLQRYGVPKFHSLLKRLGITTLNYPPEHYGLTLILGGAEASLWDITKVYTNMARVLKHFDQNNGIYLNRDVHDLNLAFNHNKSVNVESNGEVYFDYPLSAAAIWKTYQSLLMVNRPESQSGWQYFGNSRKVAWKTGTSFGFKDAWAVGTTPDYVVGVWVGNADGEGRPGLTGIEAAAPILFDIFDVLPNTNWFQPPYDEMKKQKVCSVSGFPASALCPTTDSVWVVDAPLRMGPCSFHKMVHLTSDRKFRVSDKCVPVNQMVHETWFVLPPVWEWYYSRNHPEYISLPPYKPGCGEFSDDNPIQIIYPQTLRRVYIPRDLDGSRSELVIKAAHRIQDKIIYWHLDEVFLGQTQFIHEMGLQPAMGRHTLTLIDEDGFEISVAFEVVDREE